jgi:transposase
VDKKNRDEFFCLNCSLALDADSNASLNIGKIADIGEAMTIVNKPIVAFANEDESQVYQQLQAPVL